jgi:hypothetical protein
MSKAALVMSIVSLVFAAGTLALMTLSFIFRKASYFDAN